MRSICKKGSATLVAVLALCALTAGSASAAQWYVGGKALTGTEKLAETIKVEQNIVLTFELGDGPKGEDNPTLTCTGMTAPKSELGASGTIKLGTPLLTGCKLVEPYFPACELGNGPEIGLQTLEAKMTAGKSPEDTAELASTFGSGKLWFEFQGAEGCEAFDGKGTIKGAVTLQAPKGQTETTEQELTGEGKLGKELTWSGSNVSFTGKLKLKLASGKTWSYR